ncbi:hypothetical protein [Paenibacillus dendritiformis]|uniref:hypothetical protein n=1 Tax=Paenibacillus dendritiformis TaxID=130049 RepID=UPI001BD1B1A8|nr:hypothetical protein [Paenibacillus dendritiformis]
MTPVRGPIAAKARGSLGQPGGKLLRAAAARRMSSDVLNVAWHRSGRYARVTVEGTDVGLDADAQAPGLWGFCADARCLSGMESFFLAKIVTDNSVPA